MKAHQNQSLSSGAASQSGDLGDAAAAGETAQGATASDRVDEAAPRHSDAADASANPPGRDPSLDRGMASTGAASQAEASARHATENLPERERRERL